MSIALIIIGFLLLIVRKLVYQSIHWVILHGGTTDRETLFYNILDIILTIAGWGCLIASVAIHL